MTRTRSRITGLTVGGMTAGALAGFLAANVATAQLPSLPIPPVTDAASDAASGVVDTARSATDSATDTARQTTQGATSTAQDAARSATGTARDATKSATGTARQATKGATDTARDATRSATSTARDATKSGTDAARNATRSATSTARDATRSATDTARDATRSATSTARDATRSATGTARDAASDASDTARDATRGATDNARDAADDATDAARDTTRSTTRAARDASDAADDAIDPLQDAASDATDDARDTARDVTRDARDTASDARETARDASRDARDTAQDVRRDARDTARDAREDARDVREDARETIRDTREDTRDVRQSTRENLDDVRGNVRSTVRDAAGAVVNEAREAIRSNLDANASTSIRAEDYRSADLGVWFDRSVRDGLVIADVATDAALAQVGFMEGDRVVSVNGETITAERDFIQTILAPDVRDRVEVVVLREGQQQTLYVDPIVIREQITAVRVDPLERFGVILDDRVDDRLVVWRVIPRSPAFYAGIRPGDEITTFAGHRVSAPTSFVKIVEQTDPGMVPVEVTRNGRVRAIEVDYPQYEVSDRRTTFRQDLDVDAGSYNQDGARARGRLNTRVDADVRTPAAGVRGDVNADAELDTTIPVEPGAAINPAPRSSPAYRTNNSGGPVRRMIRRGR